MAVKPPKLAPRPRPGSLGSKGKPVVSPKSTPQAQLRGGTDNVIKQDRINKMNDQVRARQEGRGIRTGRGPVVR